MACWFSFSLFFENLGSYVYDSMRARVRFCERHQRSDFFVEKLYGMRARALVCMHALTSARARGRPRRLLLSRPLGGSAAKWTNVVWPIKRRQTDSRPCRTLFGYCPPPALGSRKADIKTLSFFPTPYPMSRCAQAAIKPRHHGRQSCLCPALISFMP